MFTNYKNFTDFQSFLKLRHLVWLKTFDPFLKVVIMSQNFNVKNN
jgi:hypothetical protein